MKGRQMLNPGDRVDAMTGPITVGDELGTGGQGTVYRARTADGRDVALKWYLPDFQRPDLRESIAELVARKAPSSHFLWPDDVATRGDEFGYVMRLRPAEFHGLTRVLKRKVAITMNELVRGAAQTVAAFKELQANGLFYCDISDGNLFIDPTNGDILICDNDNVGSSRTRPRVLGTARFMAPEIVRGDRKPSALTDSFSMAVLLFLLLMNDHPLQGAAEARIHVFDAAAMNRIYGEKPVFIFDPADTSNRPVPGLHDNARIFWDIYPEALRRVFTQAFTEGLRDPGRRPSFAEWQAALSDCVDALVLCRRCGRQNFADVLVDSSPSCWKCGQPLELPMRLTMGRRVVMLNEDTCLYERHLGRRGDPANPGDARAEVVKHPTSGVLGLRNRGSAQWFIRVPGRAGQSVDPGRAVSLVPGTEIDFGDGRGVIES